ncbi:MAG: ParA family protein [Phycisphaerae bacterium]
MRRIAILNQKGGVGKTTTTANVAAALAARGNRVLVIDLDPQAHLTIHFGVDPEELEASVYQVLMNSATVCEAAVEVRENLSILGSNIHLVGAENELVSEPDRRMRLRNALDEAAGNFDFCIIDCPPSLGLLSLNALAAVDEVVIPLQPHFFALQGLSKLFETVSLVNAEINPALKISGILFCMYDSRTSLSQEVKNDIQEFLDGSRGTRVPWADAEIIPIHIRRNIKLAEAPGYGKTIYEYEPNCNGAMDYSLVTSFLTGEYIDFENAEF